MGRVGGCSARVGDGLQPNPCSEASEDEVSLLRHEALRDAICDETALDG